MNVFGEKQMKPSSKLDEVIQRTGNAQEGTKASDKCCSNELNPMPFKPRRSRLQTHQITLKCMM